MKLITSDLHISHANICKFTDRKLVTSRENHDQWLVETWNKQVTNSDLVYILGDVSFGNFDYTKEILSQMKGRKIVIKGNHDNEQNLIRLVKSGTIVSWKLYDEIDIQGTKACLFHFPIKFWNRKHYGAFHLHGHLHGNPSDISGKILDVGVDNSYNIFGEYKLFTENDIFDLMKEKYETDYHHRDIKSI